MSVNFDMVRTLTFKPLDAGVGVSLRDHLVAIWWPDRGLRGPIEAVPLKFFTGDEVMVISGECAMVWLSNRLKTEYLESDLEGSFQEYVAGQILLNLDDPLGVPSE